MRTSLTYINASPLKVCKLSLLTSIMISVTACSPVSDTVNNAGNTLSNIGSNLGNNINGIVPFDRTPSGFGSNANIGQDILQANAFLEAGQQREAANAYFNAAPNYPSPERERLMLQAAELASVFKDANLTQQYLAPISFRTLDIENQTRFRLVQAQLALNDRNHREALRILPQRIDNVPVELGNKILATRMSAAQASGDRLSLIQELVLQETSLTAPHEISLNHDRIWGHAKQIPAFQLEEAEANINHPIVKNWLSLAQLSRIETNGPASKKATFRSDLGRWIQNNPNHPGMPKALAMLTAEPTTVVTPYGKQAPRPVITSTVQKAPVITSSVTKTPVAPATTSPTPVIRSTVTTTPKPAAAPAVKADPNIKSLYNNIKKQIQEQQ